MASDIRIAAETVRTNAAFIRIGLGGCDMVLEIGDTRSRDGLVGVVEALGLNTTRVQAGDRVAALPGVGGPISCKQTMIR